MFSSIVHSWSACKFSFASSFSHFTFSLRGQRVFVCMFAAVGRVPFFFSVFSCCSALYMFVLLLLYLHVLLYNFSFYFSLVFHFLCLLQPYFFAVFVCLVVCCVLPANTRYYFLFWQTINTIYLNKYYRASFISATHTHTHK